MRTIPGGQDPGPGPPPMRTTRIPHGQEGLGPDPGPGPPPMRTTRIPHGQEGLGPDPMPLNGPSPEAMEEEGRVKEPLIIMPRGGPPIGLPGAEAERIGAEIGTRTTLRMGVAMGPRATGRTSRF